MEEYLKQLFREDGVMIFHTDYQLFFKLLNKFPNEPQRSDSYCINAILGGNAFYQSVVFCLKKSDHKLNQYVYNAFVDQMYNGERFWKKEGYDAGHFEELLRMLFEIAALDLSDIPKRIVAKDSAYMTNEELQRELKNAEMAYDAKLYRTAYEKANKLFESGINAAAGLLGMAYYTGNGTKQDYNKAMYYLSYPHARSEEKEQREREVLESILEMRDKAGYSVMMCLAGSLIVFIFMLITNFFFRCTVLAIAEAGLLAAGCVIFIRAYRRRYIFDFSNWFLLLGCMFLSVLML